MGSKAWNGLLRTLVAVSVAGALIGTAAAAWAATTPASMGRTPLIARSTEGPNTPPALPGKPLPPPNQPSLPGNSGDIPSNVTVAGHDISGMTRAEALSVIYQHFDPAKLPPLVAVGGGASYTLAVDSALSLDISAVLDEAYAGDGIDPVEIAPRYVVDSRAVYSFVTSIAAKDRPAINSLWYLSGKRLKLQASAAGQRTDVAGARLAVLGALKQEAASGLAQPSVAIPVSVAQPKITERTVGRAILVTLSERHVRLYDPGSGGIMKDYRCAVGQSSWPTPVGTFKIVLKRYLPTWVNPGSSWGTGMPSYIGPGPNNPLGTRALNLNADGIRIHGTNNIDSIGTAASHGCVRLARHDIEELYDLVVVGMPVFITK